MFLRFLNRSAELRQLEEYFSLSKKRLIVVAVSGLRRVGKTRLTKEFLKGKKALYLFVYDSKTSHELLREFSEELKKAGVISGLETVPSWKIFFEILFSRCRGWVVVFDEFQNFVSVDPSVFSVIQKNCDENSETPLNLVFLGSLVGLFKEIFEDKKEPLYGRVSAKLLLKPFDLEYCLKALELLGFSDSENRFRIMAIFGGFPKYYAVLEQFGLENKNCLDIIEYLFVRENAPLENEVQEILRQEFGHRSQLYYSILHSIAIGNTTLNGIANSVHMRESSITRHLKELEEKFGLVSSSKPLNAKKSTRYHLAHPLMRFWFAFIYDRFSQYSARNSKELLVFIQNNLNAFLGRRFEEICREILLKLNNQNALPFRIDYLGQWWGFQRIGGIRKEMEIDWIGLNKKTKQALFVECKWQEKTNALQAVQELAKKTAFVEWNNATRSESLIVFAKSFSKKISTFEGKPVRCIDLKELEKIISQN